MAKTGHPNFDYTISGWWRGAPHSWSITGNHTGAAFTGSDIATFMTGAASPMALSYAPILSPALVVSKARYYNGEDSAPTFEAVYTTEDPAPTDIQPTGLAWGETPSEDYLAIETCVLFEAQIGLSDTNKPVYVRKYLRGASRTGQGADSNFEAVWAITSAVTACATKQGDGSWFGTKAYCSPQGGQPVASAWSAKVQQYNRQVPRGRKRKTTSSGGLFSLTSAEKALLAAAGYSLIG